MTDKTVMTYDEMNIRKLSNAATPGVWDQDTGGDITRSDGTTLFTREQPGIGLNESFANTDFAIAAVNYVRALLAAAPVDSNGYLASGYPSSESGLTKREHFAGLALQAILSSSQRSPARTDSELAQFSVEYADALLDALAKEPQP